MSNVGHGPGDTKNGIATHDGHNNGNPVAAGSLQANTAADIKNAGNTKNTLTAKEDIVAGTGNVNLEHKHTQTALSPAAKAESKGGNITNVVEVKLAEHAVQHDQVTIEHDIESMRKGFERLAGHFAKLKEDEKALENAAEGKAKAGAAAKAQTGPVTQHCNPTIVVPAGTHPTANVAQVKEVKEAAKPHLTMGA